MGKILLTTLGLIAILFIVNGCHDNPKSKPKKEEYFISTQGQSDERVKKLGLDKASEDASYILDAGKLSIPKNKQAVPATDTGRTKGRVIDEFDVEALIVLKCDTPLNGQIVWDVLQSVGLKWGDGDLFHWDNPIQGYGDQAFFSVSTSTEPGYFLPERIKAGEMNPSDLVFGFSVPRSADPVHVFEVMINAAKYCRKRLGGNLLDEHLKPFNEDKQKRTLELLIRKMNDKDVVPGSDSALRTY